jgi:hypothetical protein
VPTRTMRAAISKASAKTIRELLDDIEERFPDATIASLDVEDGAQAPELVVRLAT